MTFVGNRAPLDYASDMTIAAAPQVRCPNNHVLTRYDVEYCPAGHQHHVYSCPMRRGAGSCGKVVVVPPRGNACQPER